MLPIQNILIPIDFSEHSDYALQYAKELGSPIKAHLHLVHVLEPMTQYGAWEGLPMTDLTSKAMEESEKKLQKMAGELANTDCVTHISVLQGHPDLMLNEYAAHHDINIICMGTHGRRGLEYILFGSTTEKVLRTAPCSVLAVRLPRKSS
ncbi:MAG: universal stress protein [Candidatus Kapaibacterium sp.]|nr:MAG: universal stress protein [Candidatus Kapabacteria bacterium]